MNMGAMERTNAMQTASGRDMRKHPRYRVSIEEYIAFRRQGYLVVKNLVAPEEIAEIKQHTEELMQGRLPEQRKTMPVRDPKKDGPISAQALDAPPENLSPHEKAQYFLRIHMLHRKLAIHEKYLLHPRVLDVLELLIGPDILAMQTMLFLKPPGKPGQGWHQDSYYIPTHPDMLIGAWIAVDPCDEYNGAMWFAQGSQDEPIYPNADPKQGHSCQRRLSDMTPVSGVSDVNDEHNGLSKVANKYPQVLVPAAPGDVVFFGGHVLHRSKANVTADQFRRAFVSHYTNARSFTQWGADSDPTRDVHASPCVDPVTRMTNGSHILARGDTHLPFAQPRFGTFCAAALSPEERRKERDWAAAAMADMDSGDMGVAPAAGDRIDDDDLETVELKPEPANAGY
ncbi:MAG: phytanoyl-CoA dioxygenase family protein [Planctomycetota bacterium]|nr:phytanoyl-CoA dioxygenase family protein [Planctomycetota bacterium]